MTSHMGKIFGGRVIKAGSSEGNSEVIFSSERRNKRTMVEAATHQKRQMIINLRLTHREPGGGRSPPTTTKSCSQGRSRSCRCNQTEAEQSYWHSDCEGDVCGLNSNVCFLDGWVKIVGADEVKVSRRGTHQSESWTTVTFLTGWRNETNVKEPKSWSSRRTTSWDRVQSPQAVLVLDQKQLITTSMHLLSLAYSFKCFSVC